MKKLIYLTIIGIIIGILILNSIAAMTSYQQEVTNKINNLWTKIKYEISKGFFFFTSWGESNCCSTYPDRTGWLYKGGQIRCADICSYDKCAIDVWYSQETNPTAPNWNNWFGEIKGEGASFSPPAYIWYYFELYCCPQTCEIPTEYKTKVYKCENNQWSYKGQFGVDESCSLGIDNRCWCSQENENYYIDKNGGVHCQPSTYSSINDGTWCGCEDTSWSPDASTICSGTSFIQTSNCGNTRTSTGTKSCTCSESGGTCYVLVCPTNTIKDTSKSCGTGTICCMPPTTCGDGTISGNEECDDGNTASGDGCSSSCKLEGEEKCPSGQTLCSDNVCRISCEDIGRKAQLSMTADAFDQATPEQIASAMCRFGSDCSITEILTGEEINAEDYNWTIKCPSSVKIQQINKDAFLIYLQNKAEEGGWFDSWSGFWDKFWATATGEYYSEFCDDVNMVGIMSRIGTFFSGGKTKCQKILSDMPKGTCRATIKATSEGFCWQTANNWLSPIIKSTDCQTNTIILIVAVLLIIILILRLMG